MHRTRYAWLTAILLLLGCDSSKGPIFMPEDGGTDAAPPPTDAGETDTEPPTVLETLPPNGAIDVPPDTAITIRFSEPMAESAGTVVLEIAGEPTDAPARSWTEGGTVLVLDPVAPLPMGARARVVVEADFEDRAGNPLLAPEVFGFDVGDGDAPFVVEASPAEGATGVSARTTEVRIAFSESMDATQGSVSLEGGAGSLGDIAWVLGGLIVPVSGLEYGTAYRIVLDGFADPAGNALDGEAYLGDGALDFTTGPDTDPPRVVDASPSEGQVDVAATTSAITVIFDEPMDTSITDAALTAGGAVVTVSGEWSLGGTRIDFDVAGRLERDAPHALALAGFRDAAENPLEPGPHVGDGILDFVTGVDIFAPYVGFSDPVEGATDFSFRENAVVVVFSEAMDTSVTTVDATDGTSTIPLAATWSLAGTRLELDTTAQLYAGRTYAIDFRGFTDAGGTTLDAAHPYLGDGILDFTLAPPTGESCQDALTVAEATSTSGGVTEWVLPPGVAIVNDGSNTCPGGNTPGVDALIRYEKTTPAASAGGTVLRIRVESAEASSSAWMSVAVLRDVCDPAVAGTGPARVRCVDDRNPQELHLDVGPGDYYVWVSRYTGSDFRGATVRIDEITAVPEGESCLAPYGITTSSPTYTPPALATDPHVWTLAPLSMTTVDHAVAYNGPGAMVCDTSLTGSDPDNSVGPDAVIELPKASGTSVGWVEVEPIDTSTELVVELLDRCDPTDPAAVSLACESGRRIVSGTPRTLETTFDGAAGSRFLWLAADNNYNDFPGGIVRYKEIEPAAGDTCQTAIPLAIGATNAVSPNRPHRLPAPSCFASTESVTWYRFTTTERFTHVRADADASIAAIRAASGSEMVCQSGAAAEPLVVFEPVGTEVCIGVASTTAITELVVEAFPYAGNLGTPTDLGIGRPLSSTGSPRTITLDYWMSVTPTTLYMGVGSQGVLIAPKSGGVVADFRDDVTTTLGSDGVAVSEALFTLDDTSSSSATFRVQRLVDTSGSWSPTPWDTGSAYPAIRADAITYDGTELVLATDLSTTNPTRFFSLSAAGPGAATLLGSTTLVRDVIGIAADATFFYVLGRTEASTSTEGVFRIPRSDLGATPTRLATVDIAAARASIELDALVAPQNLYFRTADGAVHVIVDPAGTAPRHLGAISHLGRSGDDAMTIDRGTGALYIFETETESSGRFVRLD